MEFEKLKKNNFPTDRPIPEKQGPVRGNKNIFKVGPTVDLIQKKQALQKSTLNGLSDSLC